jgi:hypothetical protein
MRKRASSHLSKIPFLEQKLATLIRLFGKPVEGGYVLHIPLAEVARTPETTFVIPCDDPGHHDKRKRSKRNPWGYDPQVGLCTYEETE